MDLLSRLSLKRRIALLSALLGLLLSLGFASAAWWIAEDYEELMMGVMIEAEAADARAALAAGSEPRLPWHGRLRGWHLRGGLPAPAELPPGIAELADGVHEGLPGLPEGVHATLVTVGEDRLVYLMDLEDIESLERYLLGLNVVILLIGGLASALAGQWLAGRALQPLARLAAGIEALPAPPATQSLSAGLHDPLLRGIGEALDGYQHRLAEAERAREAFFADASHELRTPIASLRGAVEVLLDDDGTPASTRRRLERIERAVDELGLLQEGLLLNGRALPAAVEACGLGEALVDALGRMQARAAARGVQLAPPQGLPGPQVRIPAGWLHVLLANVLRGLIDHAGVAEIRLAVDGAVLQVHALGIDADTADTRSDRSFPLRLARALGERLGLRIEVSGDPLQLDFSQVACART